MALRQQAISGVKWSGISMGVVTAIQFLTTAVLARLLSPSDFGLMAMMIVFIGFVQTFSDMGVSNAIIYRQHATTDQLSSLYWLNMIAGTVIFFLVCVCVPFTLTFFHEPSLRNLLYLIAFTFLITPLGQQFQVLLQKDLRFNRLAKIEIETSSVYSLTAIILAFLDFGVSAMVWGFLASVAAKALLLCKVGWQDWKPRFHFSGHDLKGYMSFGLYQMGERGITYLNSNLDCLLIGSMLGADSLGYYTLAYNLIIKPSTLINPVITKVAFPIFAKIQHETRRLKSGYLRVLQLLTTINFPIISGLAIAAPTFVPVVFGEQWRPSIVLVQVLSIVGLLRSTGNPVGSLVLAKGRADLGFKWNLGLTVTQVPVLYIGAKMGGAVGVAAASSLMQVVYCLFTYIILIRTLIGPCLRDYIGSMWPSLWMSGVMALVVLSIHGLFPTMPEPILLSIQLLAGVLVFLALMISWQRRRFNEIKNLFSNGVVSAAKE